MKRIIRFLGTNLCLVFSITFLTFGTDSPVSGFERIHNTCKSPINKGANILNYSNESSIAPADIKYPAQWVDLTGTAVDNTTGGLVNTNTTVGWATARSANAIQTGQSGYIEFVIDQDVIKDYAIGLSDPTNTSTSNIFYRILYGFYMDANQLSVYESAVNKKTFSKVVKGDVLRIEKSATGVVTYYRNDVLLYTSTVQASTDLGADGQIYYPGYRIPAVSCSFDYIPIIITHTQVVLPGQSNNDGSVGITLRGTAGVNYTYAWAGSSSTGNTAIGLSRGTYTVTITDNTSRQTSMVKSYHLGYPAQWVDLTGTAVDNTTGGLVNTNTTVGWATARSANAIQTGQSGYIEFVIDQDVIKDYAIGLSDPTNTSTSNIFYRILYGFYMDANQLSVYESAVNKKTFSKVVKGDVLRIEKSATGVVTYYRNDVLLYTSTVQASTDLGADGQIYYPGYRIPAVSCSFDYIPIIITHTQVVLPGQSNNDGSVGITLRGTAGVNYTYAWAGSSSTGNTAIGLSRGTYTVTITDNTSRQTSMVKSYHLGYPAQWVDLTGIAVDNTTGGLVNTNTTVGWATARSANAIQTGQSGYIEFVIDQDVIKDYAIGLSDPTNTSTSNIFYRILYGFYMDANQLSVYESAVNKKTFSKVVKGDVLRIEKSATGVVTYYRNDVLLYTSTVQASTDLGADGQIYYSGYRIPAVSCSFDYIPIIITHTQVVLPGQSNNDGSVGITLRGTAGVNYTYAWAGSSSTGNTAIGLSRGTYTVTITDNTSRQTSMVKSYHLGYPAQWVDLTGIAVDNTTGGLVNTNTTVGWATARSANAIQTGQSGYIEFVIDQDVIKDYAIGLSDPTNTSTSNIFYRILYGFYMDANQLSVYESAVNKKTFSKVVKGDVLRIEKSATGVVTYYRNDVLLYTSTVQASTDLGADGQIYYPGYRIPAVSCSFDYIPIIITHTQVVLPGQSNNDGSVGITLRGTAGVNYTYAWAGSSSTGNTAIGLSRGTYTVTITDNTSRQTSMVKSYHLGYPAQWVDLTGTAVDNTTGGLVNTNTTVGWATARSANAIQNGQSGYLEFVIDENEIKDYIMGLSDPTSTNTSNNTISRVLYGLYINSNQLYIYESAVNKKNLSKVVKGDVLRIEKSATGVVAYYRNNELLYTCTYQAKTNLVADGQIYYPGYRIPKISMYSTQPVNAPSSFTATPISANQINFTWADNSDNETAFSIEYKIDNGNYTELTATAPNATSYSWTAYQASVNYTFRMKALSTGEVSEYSREIVVPATSIQIISQPKDLIACFHSTVRFSINASGNNLTYQWQISQDNGNNWTNIPDAINDIYDYTSNGIRPNYSERYRCIITNSLNTIISRVASLDIVYGQPIITSQTNDYTGCEGAQILLSCKASFYSTFYQWQRSSDGNAWTNLCEPSPQNGSFAITLEPSMKLFRCVVSGCPPAATRNISINVISKDYNIGGINGPGSVCSGETVYYSFEQIVGTPLPLDDCYWQVPEGATIMSRVSPKTIKVYFSDNAVSGEVSITKPGMPCGEIKLSALSVTVPSITVPSVTIFANSSNIVSEGTIVAFNAVVTNSTGNLLYQWKVNGSNFGNSSASFSYVPSNEDIVNCEVTSDQTCNPHAKSNDFTLSVSPNIPTEFKAAKQKNGIYLSWLDNSANEQGYILQYNNNGTFETIANLPANSTNYLWESVPSKNNYTFRLQVYNNGNIITSLEIQLITDIAILTQPTSQHTCADAFAKFSITATGTDLAYQWQTSTDGTTWTDMDSQTDPDLVFTATKDLNNTLYRCVVTNSNNEQAISDAATLTISQGPQMTAQPYNQTVCENTPVTFEVATSETGLTFQWQEYTTDWADIAGQTNTTLSITPTAANNGRSYRCLITGACTLEGEAALLTVNTTPQITAQPKTLTICNGASASFDIAIVQENSTYQWQRSTDGGNSWSDINQATDNYYGEPVTTGMDGYQYRCNITNTCGITTSAAASLTINTQTGITAQPSDQKLENGTLASFSIGISGTISTYQWQSITNGTWADMAGQTAATLNITTSPTTIGYYRCMINNLCYSNPAELAIMPVPVINTQPTDQTICPESSAIFQVEATGNDISYQWQRNQNSTWTDITDATQPVYETTATNENAGTYRCRLTEHEGLTIYSNEVNLAIVSSVQINTQPANAETCEGSNVSFAVVANGADLTYQWQQSTDNGAAWLPVVAATTSQLTITATTSIQNSQYRCVITSGCGNTITTDVATLVVNTSPAITIQPVNQALCSPGEVTFTANATGANLQWQWQKHFPSDPWEDVTGANSNTCTVQAVTSGQQYRAIVTGVCGSPAITEQAYLHVTNSIMLYVQPQSKRVCENNTTTIYVAAFGQGLTYQWQSSSDGGSSWTNISGATNWKIDLTASLPLNNTQYRCQLSADCGTPLTTQPATLTVVPNTITPLTATVTPISCQEGTPNGAITLAGPTGGSTPYTYTWSNNSSAQNLTSLAAGTYTVTVTDANNCKATLTQTVGYDAPMVTSLVTTNISIPGSRSGEIKTNISGGYPPYTFQWSNGATTQDQTGLRAGTYSVTITDSHGCTKKLGEQITQAGPIVYIKKSDLKAAPVGGDAVDRKLPVATLPVSTSVSPTGAAVCEIPVETVPGLGGMEPKISITYNSQAGNGMVGWGANIAGLSAITRVPQTIYSNGKVKPIVFTMVDKYALDGNQLLVSNTKPYGADGATYKTEIENFATEIISNGTFGNNGPEWFQVTAKNGTVYRYGSINGKCIYSHTGSSVTTSAVVAWYLDYAEDVNGNYITYTYEQSGLNTYLKKVAYGRNNKVSSIGADNTIEFFYAPRADLIPVHYGLENGNIAIILDHIDVKTQNTLHRSYKFDYTRDFFSRLCIVTQSNGKKEKLNPVVLNWGDYSTGTIKTSTPNIELNNYNNNLLDQSFFAADLSNDGIADLLSVYPYDMSTPYGTKATNMVSVNQPAYTKDDNKTFTYKYTKEIGQNFNDEMFNFGTYTSGNCYGDVTGTGKSDLIVSRYQEVRGSREVIFSTINEYTNPENPRPEAPVWKIPLKTKEAPVFAMGDINNDGYDEIVYLEKFKPLPFSQSRSSKINPGGIIFTKNGTAADFSIYRLPYSSIVPERMFIADFDGDGMQDIMVLDRIGFRIFKNYAEGNPPFIKLNMNWDKSFTSGYMIQMGDFNGDGLPDFIVSPQDGTPTWALAINNGKMGFDMKPLTNIPAYNDDNTGKDDDKDNIIVWDFDNDGKSDVIITDAHYNWKSKFLSKPWKTFAFFKTWWYRSTGTGLVLDHTPVTSYNADDAYKKLFVTGDFDGDGRLDLMNYGKFNCYTGEASDDAKWWLYTCKNLKNESGVITSVKNGMGLTTNFAYEPLTNNDIYGKTTTLGYPAVVIQAPMYVAAEIKADNGVADASSLSFKYEGATIHKQGKGFLGFAKTTQTNNNTSISVETQSEWWPTYFAPSRITTQSFLGQNAISNAVKTLEYTAISGKHIYLSGENTSTNDLLKNITTESVSALDIHGNPISQVSTVGIDFYKVTKTFSGYDDKGNPATATTKMERKDEPAITIDQSFTYNANGSVNTTTSDGVTTTYTYNNWAYPETTKVSAARMDDRISKIGYDPTGRFVATRENALAHQTKSIFNTLGQVTSQKDVNDLEIISTYDDWGRLLQTESPTENKKVKYTTDWVALGTDKKPIDATLPTNAWYFTQTETVAPGDNGFQFAGAEYFDMAGHTLRKITTGYDRAKFWTDYTYNNKGQLTEVTQPYLEKTKADKSIIYTYDDYGRSLTETMPDGVIKKYIYTDSENKVETQYSTGETYTKIYDATGLVKKATDPGGDITYAYTSHNKTREIKSPGSTITMQYDDYGRQRELKDPNAGTTGYTYNPFGELETQTNADGKTTTLTYDVLGRVKTKEINGNTSTYVYDTKSPGKLSSITNTDGASTSYTYSPDKLARLATETRANATEAFTYTYGYDAKGRVNTLTYPAGYSISYGYNSNDDLTDITDAATGSLIWHLNPLNAKGQVESVKYGNGKTLSYGYDTKDRLNRLYAEDIIDFNYEYNDKQQLKNRQELYYTYNSETSGWEWQGFTEDFKYDDKVNRLETAKNGTVTLVSMAYDKETNDRIQTKNGIGTYTYQPGNHRLDALLPATNATLPDRHLTYTPFGKTATITEGNKALTIEYGVDEQRFKTQYTVGGATQYTRYFFDTFEKETNADGTTRNLNYRGK